MPFSMKNVPATFQRRMNSVICGLEGCDAYIDDLVLYSETGTQLLKKFFSRLRDANLTVNLPKSEFCKAWVLFLSHIVSQGEVSPVASKVDPIVNFPTPEDKCEVIRFLGMVKYYHKFCYNFSTIAEPLTIFLWQELKSKVVGFEGNFEQLLVKAHYEEAKLRDLAQPKNGQRGECIPQQQRILNNFIMNATGNSI